MTLRESPRSGGTQAPPQRSRVPHRQGREAQSFRSVSVSDSVSTSLTAERTDTESHVLLRNCGEPGRNRTFNQQIKSLWKSQVTASHTVIFRTNRRRRIIAGDSSFGLGATKCHTGTRTQP